MRSVLVTGATRGIGLELARQYLKAGWRVYATYRNPAGAGALSRLAHDSAAQMTVHWLDVDDHARIEALAAELRGHHLDVLINNAGVHGPRGQGFGRNEYEAWPAVWRTNVVAPLKMAEAFAANVAASERKLVVTISSALGSIADNHTGGEYAYRASKAAANMVTRCMAVDLRARGIVAVAINPGWVRTDMGGSSAPMEVEESVSRMRAVLSRLGPEDSGEFFNYDGERLPW